MVALNFSHVIPTCMDAMISSLEIFWWTYGCNDIMKMEDITVVDQGRNAMWMDVFARNSRWRCRLMVVSVIVVCKHIDTQIILSSRWMLELKERS